MLLFLRIAVITTRAPDHILITPLAAMTLNPFALGLQQEWSFSSNPAHIEHLLMFCFIHHGSLIGLNQHHMR